MRYLSDGCLFGSPHLSARSPLPGLRTALLSGLLLFAVACGTDARVGAARGDAWQGTEMEDGTTRTVRTTSGSVWGGEGRLVEELAIGTETRGEADMLAEAVGLEFHDGLIYIGDDILKTVRVYDLEGRHLADIGRAGEGPGEFLSISDVGIDRGRRHLLVREPVGVIHRLDLTGELVNRSPHRFVYSFNREDGMDMRVTRNGQAIIPEYYAKIDHGADPWFVRRFYLYTFDSSGTPVDSLELPIEDEQPHVLKAYVNRGGTFRPARAPFVPRYHWTVGWDGSLIHGTPDAYSFEIRYPDGARTVIERETETVPVEGEEKEAHRRRVYEILRDVDPRWEWDGPEIPDVKPWYSGIIPDRAGRIWVLREGKGHRAEGWSEPQDWRGWTYDPEWVSERSFDVFDEASGRFLGSVPAPEGFLMDPEPVIDGDRFFCLTKDEFDRPIVRGYRLELPASDTARG